MEKTFKAITIKTDAEEQITTLRVGDSYAHEVEIPLCQMDMVVDLLKEAKQELKPKEFEATQFKSAREAIDEAAKEELIHKTEG